MTALVIKDVEHRGSKFLCTSTFQTFFLHTTIIIQNIYIPRGTANINAYFQENGLPGCLAVATSNFTVATFLI